MTTALADTDKELLKERRQLASEIEELEAAHLRALPGLDAAVDAAAAQVEEAKEALKEAVAAHRATLGPRSDAALRFSRQRDVLECQLRDSAPPEIDACLREIQADEARLQRGDPRTLADRQARVAGLRDARRAAEGLRLKALSHDELTERLDAIREGGVDEMVA